MYKSIFGTTWVCVLIELLFNALNTTVYSFIPHILKSYKLYNQIEILPWVFPGL